MQIKKLAAMGDSLTEGYDINQSKRWTNLLRKKHNLEILNFGISGDTTAGMIGRFPSEVLASKPSHVFIMGGTNDLWLHLSISQIIANIHAMVRQAKFHNIISIIGIPPPVFQTDAFTTDTYFVDELSLGEKMKDFQQALKRYATEDERAFVDFSPMDVRLMLADGVHPNEEGQIWMANQWNL
ncbi:MAG: GDSL-type esterase/lipase family protein [Saprospiraceae bacterium]